MGEVKYHSTSWNLVGATPKTFWNREGERSIDWPDYKHSLVRQTINHSKRQRTYAAGAFISEPRRELLAIINNDSLAAAVAIGRFVRSETGRRSHHFIRECEIIWSARSGRVNPAAGTLALASVELGRVA